MAYGEGELTGFLDKADNPALPAGASQSYTAAHGYASKTPGYEHSRLGKFTAENGPTTASEWYSGANYLGTNNGWATPFMETFIDQQKEAEKNGTLLDAFNRPDATGVVTWDHKLDDGREVKFGDVMQDGRVVSNIYDQFADDPEGRYAADLLMAPLLLDGQQQARIFSDSNRSERLADEIDKIHEENTKNAPKAKKALEQQAKIEERAEDFDEGIVDEVIGVAGTVLGGLGSGFTTSLVTANPWTIAAGTLIGGAAAGYGAYANQDELTEQAARAYEITSLATEEQGVLPGVAEGLQQWSGFAMNLAMPASNVVKGLHEQKTGGINDQKVVAMGGPGDDGVQGATGRKWGLGWEVANLSATVIDSVMQFGSAPMRMLYTAEMSGSILGETAGLALTGTMYDPREGGFDNIFLDDDGNPDFVSAAAGIFKVGIDAVQLGAVRGLSRQTTTTREALEAGGTQDMAAGFRFTRDAAGNVIEKRATLALLAPSEQVAALTASHAARLAALKRGDAVTADDFYRAATRASASGNRLKAAMVNAFGEGYEEAMQAVLEPLAMDGRMSFGEMATSFAYGSAAGLGMGSAMNLISADQDLMQKSQAMISHAVRYYGGSMTDEQAADFDRMWEGLTPTEKRIRANLSPADAETTWQALNKLSQDQMATLVATEPDAAKARDARMTAVEKDLERATNRTDFYTQIGGIVDAGTVDENGNLRSGFRAEAALGSASKVLQILAERQRGLGLQVEKLTRDVETLSLSDQDDATVVARLAEAQELLDNAKLVMQAGNAIGQAVRNSVEMIYSDISEAEARAEVNALNKFLEDAFDRKANIRPQEGMDPAAVQEAAAQFVSVLHAREPKLDTGSYLVILPQISWDLTRDRADNFLQINVDVLQAINGDFDGDKLRGENQVILTRERYLQTRAGQGFAGVGEEIDIGTRNFDQGFVDAVASSLSGAHGSELADSADSMLDAIVVALENRYGQFISVKDLLDIREELENHIRANDPDTRVWLINLLARDYGGLITDRGRATLRNEWLQISQIFRANMQSFQRTYSFLRREMGDLPSPAGKVSEELTPEGKNRRKTRATTPARSVAIFADGNTLFRKFQKVHYSAYNSAVLSAAGVEYSDLQQWVAFYEELSQGITQSELARVQGNDPTANRVLAMLGRLVESARNDPNMPEINAAATMAVLANVKVKDVWSSQGEPVSNGDDISLAQLLLKRALDAEREEMARVFADDPQLQMKHARLRGLTQPGSVNAARAFVEIFRAVPFGDSLGGDTGMLGEMLTPEQWLGEYRTQDEFGRQQMEALYKGVPEYLDRAESTNLPYSLSEASTGSISTYRSMMDAMLAVGRSELTFDANKKPADSLSGDFADQNRQASEAFREVWTLVGEASKEFRKSTNLRKGKRRPSKEHIQQLFAENPTVARQLLELIPDSAVNAVFELRDGELYAPDFIYEMFAQETADEGLLHYWRTLAFAKLNSTLQRVQEQGEENPASVYDRLNSRFEQLVYDLAQDPDRFQLERLVRKMAEAQSLDDLFHWINSEPGIRGKRPPLLPFVDDTSTFDSHAGSVWMTASDSSDIRTALQALRTGAKQLRDTVHFREVNRATDTQLRQSIRRALEDHKTATRADRENLRKFSKAVSMARSLPRSFGPASMARLIRGAIRGFDAHSHDKGQVPVTFEAFGEFQALMDAFGFVPGLERTMEQVTATNVSSLKSNIGDLARTSGTAMDADGRQVEWSQLTVQDALDMLDREESAGLAMNMLSPTALDLTQYGTLSERTVFDNTLHGMLEFDGFKDLYRRTEAGGLTHDRAYKYLMLLDSMAKEHGGNFDVLRIVADLAVVRSSALTHEATESDYERLTHEAVIDVASMLQMVGRIQSNKENRDADLLKKLRAGAVTKMRENSRASRNKMLSDGRKLVDQWVQDWLRALEFDRDYAIEELVDQGLEPAELDRRREALLTGYRANRQRIESLLESDQTLATVQRFQVTGDPVADQATRVQIVDFVKSTAGFSRRAPESADIFFKLAGQLQGGNTPDLTTDEWQQLSLSSMGLFLADQTVSVAGHISIPGFPKGDPLTSDARFYPYFDTSFAFLAERLLDENSPMTAAAVQMAQVAERPGMPEDLKQVQSELDRHLLTEGQLGSWTPALMSHLVETQQRMDSSGAPGAIAAAGNGPKRWAAISFATRRTGTTENLDALGSTATLTGAHLLAEADPYNEINVTMAGGAANTMPVAMLNNRFFSSVKFNGHEIPLHYQNMGFEWTGGDARVKHRYIAIPRMRQALERWAATQSIDPATVQVEVEFLHPDSQPAGQAHNAFFDGMSHSLIPDGSESLIATLWSDNGGEISRATQWPLDAGKKGERSILPFRPVPEAQVAAAAAAWDVEHNMSKMIRAKTKIILQSDQGNGALPDEHYNAIHKTMRLQHIVVGTVDNEPVAMTADEVIAFQNLHGTQAPLQVTLPDGTQTELVGAKLVKLSPEVLRTMAGDTGSQGAPRFFDDEALLNPQDVAPLTAITGVHLARFGPGWLQEAAGPEETSLRNVGRSSQLQVRVMETREEIDARQHRVQKLNEAKARSHSARMKFYSQQGDRKKLKNDFKLVLLEALGKVGTERTGFEFSSIGAGSIGPRNTLAVDHTERLLQQLRAASNMDSLERGWRVRDEGSQEYTGGVLTVDSLHTEREEHDHVVTGDVAMVELDTFARPGTTEEQQQKRLERALDYLIDRGATIILASGDGAGDLRYYGAEYLQEHGHAPVSGSKHLYVPRATQAWTQDQKAYESTQLETTTITPAKNIVTFLAIDSIGTDENGALLDSGSTKLRDRVAVNNLLPSSKYRNYNIAVDDDRDHGVYERALTHLKHATNPANTEAREALVKMAGKDVPGAKPIVEALDDFYLKISQRSTLAPQVGDTIEFGDIIPFISSPEGRVVLYRHGLQPPAHSELRGLQQQNDGMNIALAKSKTEPMAKTNTGVIAAIDTRAGYGRSIVLEIPLQELGDKIVLEYNGMKYVVSPVPEHLDLPTGGLFRNGTRVDLWSDKVSSDKKEAFYGRVDNYRDALTFFQFDFLDDLTSFFFPNVKRGSREWADSQILTRTFLHRLARQEDFRIGLTDSAALRKAQSYVSGQLQKATQLSSDIDPDWATRIMTGRDAQSQIAYAVVTYLLTSGVTSESVDMVLRSAGFSHPQAGSEVVTTRRPPGLFADLLDQGLDSPVHEELMRRWNDQLDQAPDGSGYVLHKNWVVEAFGPRRKNGERAKTAGILQYGEAHSSGDNPVLDGQAYDSTSKAAVSGHNVLATAASLGSMTAHRDLKRSREFTKGFSAGNEIYKFGANGDSLWEMLTSFPEDRDGSMARWKQERLPEIARRRVAREEIIGLYEPLDMVGWGWSDDQRAQYENRAREILDALNLHGEQGAMVDTWVRQRLGRPYQLNEMGQDLSQIEWSDAMGTLDAMVELVRKKTLPTYGGMIPLMDVNHLTAIYMANAYREQGWAPREDWHKDSPLARSWDAWVEVSFGSAFEEDTFFDSVYLLAVDGMMHGYQNASSGTRNLPVSSEKLRAWQLMDPATEEQLAANIDAYEQTRMRVSINPDTRASTEAAMLFASGQAGVDQVVTGRRIYDNIRGQADPESPEGKQKKKLDRWRKKVDAPYSPNRTMRGVRRGGQSWLDDGTRTSSLFRTLMNWRVAKTLLNPILIIAAPIDAFYRRNVNALANAVVGENTGMLGSLSAKFSDTTIGGIAKAVGWETRYSSDELKKLNQLVDALATRDDFKSMVYQELMYQYPTIPGIGSVERAMERLAKFGGRLQDPAWGMLPRDLARIYVDTAMRNIGNGTSENIYSPETFLVAMGTNPTWLEKEDRESHNMALNAIANARSLKATPLSLAVRSVSNSLSEHHSFAVNASGNLLRMLTAFQNFWANAAINFTGMQAASDFVALMVDGREKKLGRRIEAALSGRTFDPELKEHYDMSEVLESADLADAFIKGGVTHSALFMLGLMSGGLGLSGEDDEERYRRRAAELQGLTHIHDPRELQNDYRNKQSIFLDWLPLGLDSYFKVPGADGDTRSIMQMGMISRTIFSPIIGMERFFNTGDFSEVIHGFADALGSHPIYNEIGWNSAMASVAELQGQAAKSAEEGGPDNMSTTANFLTQAFGILDNLLIESSFINAIYVGTDEYDRDPGAVLARDSDGNVQVDVKGNPYSTSAVREWVDGEESGGAYIRRSAAGESVRRLTENRFLLATAASAWDKLTGGEFAGSDFFRQNMAVKTRDVELMPTEMETAEAYFIAAFTGQGAQINLTENEARRIVRKMYADADEWLSWGSEEETALAKQVQSRANQSPIGLLAKESEDARKIALTDEGAGQVFEMLASGMPLDTAPLSGVFITFEQRKKIQENWQRRLVVEGIEMGLDPDAASARMLRIWKGAFPQDRKEAGAGNLEDIVMTDAIPWSDTVTYNQLNTGYVTGPSGFPTPTGFTRGGMLGWTGIGNRAYVSTDMGGLDIDSRLNSVDPLVGINTGIRALEARGENWIIPTPEDVVREESKKITDTIKDEFKDLKSTLRDLLYDNDSSGGGGYRGFGWGYGGYGGRRRGGGGSYAPNTYFTRMNNLPGSMSAYGNSIPFINTSNPYIRRSYIRRERVWSERGRLKQWQ